MGDGTQKGGWRSDPNKKGWFSRRHQTSEAHDTAVARYKQEHGRAARKRKAAERAAKKENGD